MRAQRLEHIQRDGAATAQHNRLNTFHKLGQNAAQSLQIELLEGGDGGAQTLAKVGIRDLLEHTAQIPKIKVLNKMMSLSHYVYQK